jgi:hypothetical protein
MSPSETAAAAGSRSVEVVWRLAGAHEFPLEGLLRLLFEPDPEQDEAKGGDGRARSA